MKARRRKQAPDKPLPRAADGLRYAAEGRDAILDLAGFHLNPEALRQDIFNWLVSAYDKGVADGRVLAEAEGTAAAVAQAARAFVRALEAARAAHRSAEIFPKDVILDEAHRLDDLAAEKYALLKRALEGVVIMTRDDLNDWRAFCEWLDGQKYKAAYSSEVPARWRRFVYVGGNHTGDRARELRLAARLIFYRAGWGWRLKKNWRERLAELETSISETVIK